MEEKEASVKRSLTPDVSRGIAIFLVIWGHVIQQGLNGITEVSENPVFKWIYSFHMPLFMVISGFFFYRSQKKKVFKSLVIDKIIGLLRTLVIWNTICYGCKLLFLLLQNKGVTVSVEVWLEEVLMGYWFLWAIVLYTVIMGIVTKMVPQKWWFAGCILLIPVLMLSPCRWVILSMYPFFVIGFFYSKAIDNGWKVLSCLKYLLIGCYIVGMAYYLCVPAIGNGEIKELFDACIGVARGQNNVSDVLQQLIQTGLFYFLGITGSVTIISLSDWLGRKKEGSVVVRSIAQMGQYSLQIYILQRVLVEIILSNAYQSVIAGTGSGFMEGNVFGFTYVGSLVVSLICAFLIFMITRHCIGGKIVKFLFAR